MSRARFFLARAKKKEKEEMFLKRKFPVAPQALAAAQRRRLAFPPSAPAVVVDPATSPASASAPVASVVRKPLPARALEIIKQHGPHANFAVRASA